MKHMEETMKKLVRAAKIGGKKTKCLGGPKRKNVRIQLPTLEDDGSPAKDRVLWPARVIGCCD